MAENHTRCRFFPRCAMHLGHTRPQYLTEDNLTEMRQLHGEGWYVTEIAEAFETSVSTVTKAVKDRRDQ